MPINPGRRFVNGMCTSRPEFAIERAADSSRRLHQHPSSISSVIAFPDRSAYYWRVYHCRYYRRLSVRTHLLTSDNLSMWRNNRALEMSSASGKDRPPVEDTRSDERGRGRMRRWARDRNLFDSQTTSPTNQRLSRSESKRTKPELARHSSIKRSWFPGSAISVDGSRRRDEVNGNGENIADISRNYICVKFHVIFFFVDPR